VGSALAWAPGGWLGGCGPSREPCSCSRWPPGSASSTIATRRWCRPCSACRASAPTSPASTASAAASRADTSTCWSSATTRASTRPVSTGRRRLGEDGLRGRAPCHAGGTVGARRGGYPPLQAGLPAMPGCQAVPAPSGTPQPAQGHPRKTRMRALRLCGLWRGPGMYFGRSADFSARANVTTWASPSQHPACPATLFLPKCSVVQAGRGSTPPPPFAAG